jgi:endonuclease/exonuclease/phosphatase (EEP) superfamily protein YafD
VRSRAWALELAGWAIVALVGAVTLTQAFAWAGTRSVAVIQSLTPYLGLLVVAIALVALWRRRLQLATVCAAIGFGILVVAAPLAFPGDQADPMADAIGLRVASVNLLYRNERIGDVAETLTDLAPDVIVFSEYTAEHQAALQRSRLAADYPHRIDRSDQFAGGVAVWSRMRVVADAPPDTYNYSLDVIVDGHDGAVRIVALHAPTPLVSFENWRRDLRTAAEIGRDVSRPTMLIGDFNASYWHPDFRRMLDAGLVDAHTALGQGFSTSWPAGRPVPPFVRLDHALTTPDLVSTEITDFEIPGSDHRGFVVTVAPAR